MSDPTASQAFFDPASPFGALADWECQSENPQETCQRAQALKSNGDELRSKNFNHKTTVSADYTANAATAAIPKAGAVLNGFHVDTVTVKYNQNDFAKMTITGHKHGSPAANHPACRTYTGSLATVGVIFGCPATLPGILNVSGAGVRSATYTLGCSHIDEPGSQGEFLAAGNHDGVETSEVEFCDTLGATGADTTNGWSLSTRNTSLGNTQADAVTVSAEHHIQKDSNSANVGETASQSS